MAVSGMYCSAKSERLPPCILGRESPMMPLTKTSSLNTHSIAYTVSFSATQSRAGGNTCGEKRERFEGNGFAPGTRQFSLWLCRWLLLLHLLCLLHLLLDSGFPLRAIRRIASISGDEIAQHSAPLGAVSFCLIGWVSSLPPPLPSTMSMRVERETSRVVASTLQETARRDREKFVEDLCERGLLQSLLELFPSF